MELNISVLIVDDSIISRRLIKVYLTRMGISRVFEAEGVNKALKWLEEEKVDLIISDWNMPGESGLAFLKWIRGHERYGEMPFIMLTAEGLKSSIQEAEEAGVSKYVLKPLKYDDFKLVIEDVLENQ
jgi:two-component system chemotaxis response regulator CheY